MENETFFALFKIQFVLAQSFYFLFLAFFFGLSLLLAMMESIYVLTGKAIFQTMTQFWSKFFVLNILMGLVIGFIMPWRFGANWQNYASMLGNIFCAPSSLGGKGAIWIEVLLIGFFFFGWRRLNQKTHLLITWLMAIGANICALPILFKHFSILPNPQIQLNFIHTVTASYVVAAIFVVVTSAYYLMKKSAQPLAKRSLAIAAIFGGIGLLSFLMHGNEISLFISDVKPSCSVCIPIVISLSGFMLLYVLLMLKFAKSGPTQISTKRYYFESA